MNKVDHSGRPSKWCIELSEYDITYEPKKAIKAQALANFIAEVPNVEESQLDLGNNELE